MAQTLTPKGTIKSYGSDLNTNGGVLNNQQILWGNAGSVSGQLDLCLSIPSLKLAIFSLDNFAEMRRPRQAQPPYYSWRPVVLIPYGAPLGKTTGQVYVGRNFNPANGKLGTVDAKASFTVTITGTQPQPVPPSPKAHIISVNASPNQVSPGGAITVTVVLLNQGVEGNRDFEIRYNYQCVRPDYDANNKPLGTTSIHTICEVNAIDGIHLRVGETVPKSTSIGIPAEALAGSIDLFGWVGDRKSGQIDERFNYPNAFNIVR